MKKIIMFYVGLVILGVIVIATVRSCGSQYITGIGSDGSGFVESSQDILVSEVESSETESGEGWRILSENAAIIDGVEWEPVEFLNFHGFKADEAKFVDNNGLFIEFVYEGETVLFDVLNPPAPVEAPAAPKEFKQESNHFVVLNDENAKVSDGNGVDGVPSFGFDETCQDLGDLEFKNAKPLKVSADVKRVEGEESSFVLGMTLGAGGSEEESIFKDTKAILKRVFIGDVKSIEDNVVTTNLGNVYKVTMHGKKVSSVEYDATVAGEQFKVTISLIWEE